MVGLLLGELVSIQKKRQKGCGWLAYRRGSKYEKKHILAKDVVGLLVGDNEDLLIISQN